jgi:hypothetical protein
MNHLTPEELQTWNKQDLIDKILFLQKEYTNMKNKVSWYIDSEYDLKKQNTKLQNMIIKDCEEIAALQCELDSLKQNR